MTQLNEIFPKISESVRLERLQLPSGILRMVLDTDTYNEVDDQFALVYALLSPQRLKVEAVYAAPFHNDRSSGPAEGMEKSYDEIIRLLDKMSLPSEGLVYRGSIDYLTADLQPQRSDAALDLVERAMSTPDGEQLYVVAIAAITNVASAMLIEPRIIEKICVVWLGGHALFWPDTLEFNLKQDLWSSRIMFDSGVPLVHVPCKGVTTHLRTTISELDQYVRGRSAIGDYLAAIVASYATDSFAWSKEIWDVAAVAYLINERWMETEFVHAPMVSDQFKWSFDNSRHFMRYVRYIHRDPIFGDLFRKLETLSY